MSVAYRGAHVAYYARYRPNNFNDVIECTLQFLSEKLSRKDWTQAVDVGTGSGQCASLLAPHFKDVFGYDSSQDQIDKAKSVVKLDNVHFGMAPAEKLPLPSASTDLMTCSMAMHLFDHNTFYTEARRVLKPNGVLAGLGYSHIPLIVVENDKEKSDRLTKLVDDTYNHPFLKEVWVLKNKVVDRCYHGLPFPFEDKVHREDFTSTLQFKASELVGYVKSWADTVRLENKDSKKADQVIDGFIRSVAEIFGPGENKEEEIDVKIIFTHFVLMGRNN